MKLHHIFPSTRDSRKTHPKYGQNDKVDNILKGLYIISAQSETKGQEIDIIAILTLAESAQCAWLGILFHLESRYPIC